MQAPKRLSIKLFVENPTAVSAEALVPVFQRWIQQDVFPDELLIDVADYKHVHHGSGILLVGHEGDYAYQSNEGRVGLAYTLKQHNSSSLQETVSTTLSRLLRAAKLLHNQHDLNDLRVSLTELQITLLDRLNYPNDEATALATRDALSSFFTDAAIVNEVEVQSGEKHDALRLLVTAQTELDLDQLQFA